MIEFEYNILGTEKKYKYKPYTFKRVKNNEGLQGFLNLHRFLNQVRDIYKKNDWKYEDWYDEYYQSQFESNY